MSSRLKMTLWKYHKSCSKNFSSGHNTSYLYTIWIFMLVHKKDGGLPFCIDFQKLNATTKKDSYLLPRIQEAIESLVGVGYFSCLKADFWRIGMDKASNQYTAFTVGNLAFLNVDICHLGCAMPPNHISKINAELPGRTEPNLLLNWFGWCDSLLEDGGGAHTALVHCVWILPGT